MCWGEQGVGEHVGEERIECPGHWDDAAMGRQPRLYVCVCVFVCMRVRVSLCACLPLCVRACARVSLCVV